MEDLLFKAFLLGMMLLAFAGMSFSSTTILGTSPSLGLANSISLSSSQTAFLNSTVNVISIYTTYQQPPVTNIKQLTAVNWTATTYITLYSSYPLSLPISNIYFKSLVNNPSSIQIYQLNSTENLIPEYAQELIGYDTGTNNGIPYNNPQYQEVQIGSVMNNATSWVSLDSRNIILYHGYNEFEVTGKAKSGTSVDWEAAISSSNIITGDLSSSSALKVKSEPLTTLVVDPIWQIPVNTLYIVNITLKNNAAVAINANTPVLVTVNGINDSSIFNGNLINFGAINGITGNILPSWLEGNTYNEYQSNSFNSVNSLALWVLLPSQIAASTNAVNVISLYFLPMQSSALSSITGIAPQLECSSLGNCPQTSYGQYDNGANVFAVYTGFAGSSTPSGWSVSGTPGTINNGFTGSIVVGATGSIIQSQNVLTGNYEMDFLGNLGTQNSVSTDQEFVFMGNVETSNTIEWATAGGALCSAIGAEWVPDRGLGAQNGCHAVANGINVYTANLVSFKTNTFPSNGIFTANYIKSVQLGGTAFGTQQFEGSIGFYVKAYGTTTATIQWMRAENVPANSVQPIAFFGGEQSGLFQPVKALFCTSLGIPNINSTSTYQNSNTAALAVFVDSNVINTGYYSSGLSGSNTLVTSGNEVVNATGTSGNRQSTTLIIQPKYYFEYTYASGTNLFHCEWIQASSSGGSTAYTATAPLSISATNVISLNYNSLYLGLDGNNYLNVNSIWNLLSAASPLAFAGNALSCATCTYNSLYIDAITGTNGILATTSGQSVALAVNVVSPLTNVSLTLGCPTCFTGTTSTVSTSIYTTTSSTSTIAYYPIYTASNGIIITSANVIEINANAPLANSIDGQLSLLYGSPLYVNAEYELTSSAGGGTTYTVNAPLAISQANEIYLNYNFTLALDHNNDLGVNVPFVESLVTNGIGGVKYIVINQGIPTS